MLYRPLETSQTFGMESLVLNGKNSPETVAVGKTYDEWLGSNTQSNEPLSQASLSGGWPVQHLLEGKHVCNLIGFKACEACGNDLGQFEMLQLALDTCCHPYPLIPLPRGWGLQLLLCNHLVILLWQCSKRLCWGPIKEKWLPQLIYIF